MSGLKWNPKTALCRIRLPATCRTAASRGLVLAALSSTGAAAPPNPTYSDLAPILAQRCMICHAGEAAPLGLKLDSHAALLKGGANGPVVKAGDPAGSELIRRLKGTSQPRMPLTGPPFLSDDEIALFERWVVTGMPAGTAATVPAPSHPTRPTPGEPVTYRHVAAIFTTRCVKCHTDNGLLGPAPEGFRLNSYATALDSSDRARIVPGNPQASELVRRIRGQATPRMPFDGPPYLDEDDIRLIEEWIVKGARDDEGRTANVPAGARVRLHGTLESGGRLDGLGLVIGGRTRMDKAPRPGDYVEVRGTLDGRGNVVVERLRRR